MKFEINENKFKSSFMSSKGFEHNKGNLIKLFPFATDTAKLSDSKEDLKCFKGISATFFRNCKDIDITSSPDKDELVSSILSEFNTSYNSELKIVIEKLIFDDLNNLFLFNSSLFSFVDLKSRNSKLNNIQDYVANLLIDTEVKDIVSNVNIGEQGNVLYDLILKKINDISSIKSVSNETKGYYNGPIIKWQRDLFKIDLKNLSSHGNNYIKNIPILIKYYFFNYLVQLTFDLDQFFSKKKGSTPLYFTLEWEKLSRSRFALENGWKKLESSTESIFAHANCLELLNTIEDSSQKLLGNTPVIYSDILLIINNDPSVDEDLSCTINELINRYKRNIENQEKKLNFWSEFDQNYDVLDIEIDNEFDSTKLIHKLFAMVKYQFLNSGRKRAYSDYSRWFKYFIKLNYYKARGSLGGTLAVDKDLILLLTELSILENNHEKILVSKLWIEFEKRNLFLDDISKKEIIKFFEKINILEKKSDSGNAQYVKRLYS